MHFNRQAENFERARKRKKNQDEEEDFDPDSVDIPEFKDMSHAKTAAYESYVSTPRPICVYLKPPR
jgi:hypothetical protein